MDLRWPAGPRTRGTPLRGPRARARGLTPVCTCRHPGSVPPEGTPGAALGLALATTPTANALRGFLPHIVHTADPLAPAPPQAWGLALPRAAWGIGFPIFATAAFSHKTTRSDFIAWLGLLTAHCVRDITAPSYGVEKRYASNSGHGQNSV